MTVSTEISSNEYTGNGVTTDFDYKFRIFKANQLSVITSDADGDNVVTLRLGTDYTVTGANKSAGGKVILTKPLANGHKISIYRDIPITQETSFRNQSKFFAETHEDAFDYLTMIVQRIWGSLGSLYLKRPNILANWFDAKGYRIANLGKPKRDSDAVDLGTMKDEIEVVNSTVLKREKRLLRVDDMDIAAFPKATERRNKQIGFDKSGSPTLLDPVETGALGYVLVDSFEEGALITSRYQALHFNSQGEFYRWDGDLPKAVPADSTPQSTGGIGKGAWVSVGDASVRSDFNHYLDEFNKANRNNFIFNFGATADYKGTPVYDGNDSTRITATDNSSALLRAFSDGDVINGVLTINIPAGHYGFKTELGNISLRPDVEKVVFVGSGREETILDFIYEDLTSRKNPSPLEAHKLFMLTGLQKVTFVNMTVKCTTKHGTVDGSTNPSPDNPSVYYGAVWFAHLQDCHSVRFENTDATRGNYRCVSVSGSGMPVGFRTKVSLVNCNGYYNTSTGFWLDHCGSLQVMGGEYYRNGTVGLLATGYGIAASQYVDDIFVANAKFYENYRKGFDRHGGVGSFVISNCTFTDNILRDIEDIKQYSGEYPTDKVNFNSISNCNFYLNANKPFLAEALSAVNNHPSTLKCFISSIEGALIPSNLRQEQLDIVSCNVKVFGNIPVGYQGFNGFNTAAKTTILSNCDIDTTGFLIDANVTGDVYSSYMFALMRDDGVISFSNTKIKAHPGRIISSINGQPSNSIFILTGANAQVTANNLTAELTNFVLMGTSGSGGAYQSDAVRDFTSSTFIFRNAQLYTHNQQTTNALTWLTNGFGFQPVTKQPKINNCLIGLGDANTLYEYSNHKNSLNTSTFKINGGDRKKDEKDYLFTGFINGDFNVELTGRSELFNDNNVTTFRYSSKQKVEYLASAYISVTYYGEGPITLNGNNTNFLATVIGIGWKQDSRGSIGWYDGVITAKTKELGVLA